MSRAKRYAALACLPVLAISLGGCASDAARGTQVPYAQGSGAGTVAGSLEIRNVLLVSDGEDAVSLLGVFANRSAREDALREVRINGERIGPDQPIAIPANGYVSVGSGDGPRVQGSGLDVQSGRFAEVEFFFTVGPRTSVNALVIPATGDYEGLGPTPAPSPTAPPAPTPTTPESPAATESPESTPSPTS